MLCDYVLRLVAQILLPFPPLSLISPEYLPYRYLIQLFSFKSVPRRQDLDIEETMVIPRWFSKRLFIKHLLK